MLVNTEPIPTDGGAVCRMRRPRSKDVVSIGVSLHHTLYHPQAKCGFLGVKYSRGSRSRCPNSRELRRRVL